MRRPDRGREFFAERENTSLERLKSDFAIGKIFEADAIEIVLPDIDRQVFAPIIGDTLEDNEMTRIESADFIGTGAERRLKRRLVERILAVIGGGENRLAGDDQRRFAAGPGRNVTRTMSSASAMALTRSRKDWRDGRMALRFAGYRGKDDIVRRQRRAVVEARLLAQEEAIGELVCRNPHLFGDQPIKGVGLVAVAHHQRIEDRAHAGRAIALQDIVVEGIERRRADVGATPLGCSAICPPFGACGLT